MKTTLEQQKEFTATIRVRVPGIYQHQIEVYVESELVYESKIINAKYEVTEAIEKIKKALTDKYNIKVILSSNF